MDFGISEEQVMLKKTVRKFIENQCPTTRVREVMEDSTGFSSKLWREMADLGWMGLNIPEEYDGIGMGFMDLVVVMEEVGRAVLPAPLMETAMAAEALLLAGTEAQKKEYLTRIASGELVASLAIDEPTGYWEAAAVNAEAIREGNRFIVSGTKLFVPYANVAGMLVCAVRTSRNNDPEQGVTLMLIDPKSPGVSVNVLTTMDEAYRLCEVQLDRVSVGESQVLGEIDTGWQILEKVLQKASVALAAETVGGSERALEIALQYAKERVQFGKVIGSFQAIKHKLADMLVKLENNRSAVYYAGWALENDAPDAAVAASVAMACGSDTYYQTSGEAIQILGGIGFTWEHDIHLFFKRAKRIEIALGNASYHREKIAQLWLDAN